MTTSLPAGYPREVARVHLTFDDGPDPVWTPRVARALEAAGATATFFVMAGRAAAHPDLVEALLDAGHGVELHCLEHLRHTEVTRERIEHDTDAGLGLLGGLGVHPRRWRLPWGRPAPWSAAVAERRGLALTGWTADTHDWRGDRTAAMATVLGPGAVVLCHDGLGPGARRADCAQTVAFVDLAAAWAERREVSLEALPAPAPAAQVAA